MSEHAYLKTPGRRRFFRVAGTTSASILSGTAMAAGLEPTDRKNNIDLVNVIDFGASGKGLISDHNTFQLAIDHAASNKLGGIFIPPGRYLLSKPVRVPGFMVIQGVGGHDFAGQQGTVVLPTTVAFMPKVDAAWSQEQGFVCRNVTFVGGTIPVDLGLRHECTFEDLTFINPAVAAISIVRGERHEFKNIRVYSQSNDCKYGLALASPRITTIPFDAFDFGKEGPWVDRVSVDKLVFMFGAYHVLDAIHCDGILSNFNSRHIVCQGVRGRVLFVGKALQYSHITNLIMDQCDTSGPLIQINKSLQNVLTDVSPGSSGNNVYQTGIRIAFSANTVFIDCNASGNNKERFGFWFGEGVGQAITLIGCQGALYLNNRSRLQKDRITQVACNWSHSNTEGSAGLTSTDNRDITLTLMADANGAKTATSSVRMVAAIGKGSGDDRTIMEASLSAVAIGGGAWNMTPVRFGNRYEWYDAAGNKRAKVGPPNNDVDGTIISARPVI